MMAGSLFCFCFFQKHVNILGRERGGVCVSVAVSIAKQDYSITLNSNIKFPVHLGKVNPIS